MVGDAITCTLVLEGYDGIMLKTLQACTPAVQEKGQKRVTSSPCPQDPFRVLKGSGVVHRDRNL